MYNYNADLGIDMNLECTLTTKPVEKPTTKPIVDPTPVKIDPTSVKIDPTPIKSEETPVKVPDLRKPNSDYILKKIRLTKEQAHCYWRKQPDAAQTVKDQGLPLTMRTASYMYNFMTSEGIK